MPAPRRLRVYAAIAMMNVGLFLVLMLNGVHWIEPAPGQFIAWGANVPALTLTGEPWRLLTSIFLHMGLLHLALNTYMLVGLGGLAEDTVGKLRFTLVYLMSGLFAGLASAYWHGMHRVAETFTVGPGQVFTIERLQPSVSVGASGALMGIAGAFLAQLLVAHARKEQHKDISLRGPLAQTIAINLGIGFIIPIVDNAGHIGGLVAGALLGGAFALFPGRKAAIAIVAASCALLYLGLQVEPSAELLMLKKLTLARIIR